MKLSKTVLGLVFRIQASFFILLTLSFCTWKIGIKTLYRTRVVETPNGMERVNHEALCQVQSGPSVSDNQLHRQSNKGPEMSIQSDLINQSPFTTDEFCTQTQSAFHFDTFISNYV